MLEKIMNFFNDDDNVYKVYKTDSLFVISRTTNYKFSYFEYADSYSLTINDNFIVSFDNINIEKEYDTMELIYQGKTIATLEY